MSDIDSQLAGVKYELARLSESQSKIRWPSWRPAAVRSFVTRLIIWLFCMYIVGMALYVAFQCDVPSKDRITYLFEILKTAVLPVVTFVIGHYFGSKADEL